MIGQGLRAQQWRLVGGMCAAIALVTAVAWWDARNESAAALSDFGAEQSAIAASLAGVLRARFEPVAQDAVDARVADLASVARDLADRARDVEHAGALVVLLAPPGTAGLYTMEGRVLESKEIRAALARGASTLRLSRPEAAAVGLPQRTAMAGLSRVPSDRGQWGIVVVATAARGRDRENRAFWRLVLGVVLASGLVLAFGGLALRKQRAELELEAELAVAEARRERDADLLRATRAATMGTFAMGIAHEIATPLGVIVGRAEQLESRLRGDSRAENGARTILKQADQIQQTVRRFLDLARGGPPALGRADCAEIARAAAASVSHRFAKAGVALGIEAPSERISVQCDRSLLEHALVNLLLNACEASDPGARVELQVRADSGRVAFDVTDEGVGISAEHAARATEPFFTTKLETGGTGLGLAIAGEIAKSHRGELTIGPHAPRGTRACISIPSR
jgi:signal transduction histidine kinase